MENKIKTNNAEKLNAGMKAIVNKLEVNCHKIKQLEGNDELYNQFQNIVKTIKNNDENIDHASKMSNCEDSCNSLESFYLNKTGVSFDALAENVQLETAANILLETGVDDYNSNSLFTKYMSIIEKCAEEKQSIDDIDEYINKLKEVIEQQNELKSELSHITYTPIGYTAKPISEEPIETVDIDDECDNIMQLIKKISELEKKQADVCKTASELKSEQKKNYHGLPPNLEQAAMAVQIAERTMKSVSKKLAEKLGKK